MIAAEFAPAKVNLFLHVGPPGADGFHPLSSLMVFADVGDRLAATPAERFSLELEGPMQGDAPPGDDNLVVRAVRALCEAAGAPEPKLALTLDKQLPAGAGLGGGSSDAAAALRLVRRALALEIGEEALFAVAASLGSDIPACLAARPVLAQGRGERLSPGPALGEGLPAVLIRPPATSSTPAVYRAYDRQDGRPSAAPPAMPRALATPAEAAAFVAATRNDLEAPAVALEPLIGEALTLLRAQPESLAVRMSGSGSACFALCSDDAAAGRLADRLAAARPGWWVRACRLGGAASPLP